MLILIVGIVRDIFISLVISSIVVRLLLAQLTVQASLSSANIKQMARVISGNVQYLRTVADKLRARRLARTGKEPAETAAVFKEPNMQYWTPVADKLRVRRLARTGKKP